MKKYKGLHQRQLNRLAASFEIIIYLQDSGKDVKFREEVELPIDGAKDADAKAKWLIDLYSNKEKLANFRLKFQELVSPFGLREDEIEIIKGYLISGEEFMQESRILFIANPITNNTELYIRIDSLTEDEAQELVKEARELHPDLVKPSQFLPTREWSVLRYKRFRDLQKKGKTYSQIANELTEEMQKIPESEPDETISVESIKQIMTRGKKHIAAISSKVTD